MNDNDKRRRLTFSIKGNYHTSHFTSQDGVGTGRAREATSRNDTHGTYQSYAATDWETEEGG